MRRTKIEIAGALALAIFGAGVASAGETRFSFDSAESIRAYRPQWPAAKVAQSFCPTGAVNGCLSADHFGWTWPKGKRFARGVFSFWTYAACYEAYDTNPPLEMNLNARTTDGRDYNYLVSFYGGGGWVFRDRRPVTREVPGFRRQEHGGWFHVAIVAEDGVYSCYVDGILVHVFDGIVGINGFDMTQKPSPTRWDEFVISDDPKALVKNPVSRILPNGAAALKPDEPLTLPALVAKGTGAAGAAIELELRTKRNELLASAKTDGSAPVRLGCVPRSGSYTIVSKYTAPGLARPLEYRENVSVTVVDPAWNDPRRAPLNLELADWDFIGGGFKIRHHFDRPKPTGGELKHPDAVPADWRGARKLSGPWSTGRFGNFGVVHNAGWYRLAVDIPRDWPSGAVRLTMADVMTRARVFANGRPVGEVEWPLGDVVIPGVKGGSRLDLAIHVIADPNYGWTRITNEADGGSMGLDGLSLRGLAGRVTLAPETPGAARIACAQVVTKVCSRRFDANFDVDGLAVGRTYELDAAVLDAGRELLRLAAAPFVATAAAQRVTASVRWDAEKDRAIRRWDLRHPYLHDLVARVGERGAARTPAMWPVRFGFREVDAKGVDFKLNGVPYSMAMMHGSPCDSFEYWREISEQGMSIVYAGARFDLLDEYGLAADRTTVPLMQFGITALADLAARGSSGSPEFWRRAEETSRKIMSEHWNHPSVIMFTGFAAGNRTGQGSCYNPLFGNGTWIYRNENTPRNAATDALGKRALAQRKALAPNQIVTSQDAGSFNDARHITSYPGFLPMQELGEQLAWYRKISVTPLFVSEQAAPMFPNWTDALSQGKGWDGVPCYAEWMAAFCGDRAYLPNDRYDRLLTEMEASVAGRPGARMRLPVGFIQEKHPDLPHARLTRDRMREHTFYLRAFGAGIHNFNYVSGVDRAACFREFNRPRTGFLSGPAGNICDRKHLFRPGERLRKAATLMNNDAERGTFALAWRVSLGGRTLDARTQTVTLEPGEVRQVPIECALPAVAADATGAVHLDVSEGGAFVRSDDFTFDILAPLAYRGGTVALVDPERSVVDLFRRLGIPYVFRAFDEENDDFDTIVYGRRAFDHEFATRPEGVDLGALAAAGKRIVILEQSEKTLRSRFGFRTEYLSPRRMFFRGGAGHPLAAGLPDRLLANWRGAATLTDGYEVAADGRNRRGTWFYAWNDGEDHHRPVHWGNTHNVATVTVIKPETGAFRPLADSGFNGDYLTAFEYVGARGKIVFSQVDAVGRTESDPAADRWILNLIGYAAADAAIPSRHARMVRSFATPETEKLLASLGTRLAQRGEEAASAGAGALAVADSVTDEVRAFAGKGGTVLVLGGCDLKGLAGFETKSNLLTRTIVDKPTDPLLAGLGNAEFLMKGHTRVSCVTDTNLTATGVVAARPCGKGRVVVCRVTPSLFGDVRVRHWLEPSARMSRQVIRQLLTNLGAEMAPPGFLVPPPSVAEPLARLDAAGAWRVIRSDAETCPPASDPGWRDISLPGRPQALFPEWKAIAGTYWYRRELVCRVPERKGGSVARVHIGSVSGKNRLYSNGRLVGHTDEQTDINTIATCERNYVVPSSLFGAGPNELTMRVEFDRNASLGNRNSEGGVKGPFEIFFTSAEGERIVPEAGRPYLRKADRAADPYWWHAF